MRIDEIINKDAATRWLRSKIEEGWNSSQIGEIVSLTSGIPLECRILLNRLIEVMEKIEFQGWIHERQIRCENCGYHRQMTVQLSGLEKEGVWTPGVKCPKCSSEQFYPVVRVESTGSALKKLWKKNPALFTVLIVLIIAGVYRGIKIYMAKHIKPVEATFVCLEDGKYFNTKVSTMPVKCAYCGEKKAYMAIKCNQCGEIFVWPETNWLKNPPVCPECGSKDVNILQEPPEN